MDAETSSRMKRKKCSGKEADSDDNGNGAKVIARDYASTPNNPDPTVTSPSQVSSVVPSPVPVSGNLKVLLSGEGRLMKSYHPDLVNKALYASIGSYADIKVLRSGDILITCNNEKQAKQLLDCTTLKSASTTIKIKTSIFQPRPYASRAVIPGVPVEISEQELLERFRSMNVIHVKRLTKKTKDGTVSTTAVLLSFSTFTIPPHVMFHYLRFKTRQYNPPPTRCFQCNRFGHVAKHCRGTRCCSKCGGRDHTYDDCSNNKKCVNCNEEHSAAYGGCIIYKEEAKINALREEYHISLAQPKETPESMSEYHKSVIVDDPAPNRLNAHMISKPYPQRPSYRNVLARGRSCGPIAPQPNDGDLRHCRQPPPSRTAANPTVETATSGLASIEPVVLLALIAEIVKITVNACKSSDSGTVLHNIVAKAASKYLGFSVDPVSLKNVTKSFGETEYTHSQTSNNTLNG